MLVVNILYLQRLVAMYRLPHNFRIMNSYNEVIHMEDVIKIIKYNDYNCDDELFYGHIRGTLISYFIFIFF